MAKTKSSNPFPDYVRGRQPDKAKLAELTRLAQGERSITQFAKECGVNPSTLTRLLHEEGSRPNSDDLIAAIASNAAPDSGVTLDMLLEAHGLVKLVITREDIERGKEFVENFLEKYGDVPISEVSDRRAMQINSKLNEAGYYYKMTMEARETVVDALIRKGYRVEEIFTELDNSRRIGDFGIKTDAVAQYGLTEWVFEIKHNPAGMGNRLMNQVFAMAYMHSPKDQGIKVSYVTEYRADYEQLVERCRSLCIYDVISILLIDSHNKKIRAEFQIPCKGMEMPASIFEEEDSDE